MPVKRTAAQKEIERLKGECRRWKLAAKQATILAEARLQDFQAQKRAHEKALGQGALADAKNEIGRLRIMIEARDTKLASLNQEYLKACERCATHEKQIHTLNARIRGAAAAASSFTTAGSPNVVFTPTVPATSEQCAQFEQERVNWAQERGILKREIEHQKEFRRKAEANLVAAEDVRIELTEQRDQALQTAKDMVRAHHDVVRTLSNIAGLVRQFEQEEPHA